MLSPDCCDHESLSVKDYIKYKEAYTYDRLLCMIGWAGSWIITPNPPVEFNGYKIDLKASPLYSIRTNKL